MPPPEVNPPFKCMLSSNVGNAVNQFSCVVDAWLWTICRKTKPKVARNADKRHTLASSVLGIYSRKTKGRGRNWVGRLDSIEIEAVIAEPDFIYPSLAENVGFVCCVLINF